MRIETGKRIMLRWAAELNCDWEIRRNYGSFHANYQWCCYLSAFGHQTHTHGRTLAIAVNKMRRRLAIEASQKHTHE